MSAKDNLKALIAKRKAEAEAAKAKEVESKDETIKVDNQKTEAGVLPTERDVPGNTEVQDSNVPARSAELLRAETNERTESKSTGRDTETSDTPEVTAIKMTLAELREALDQQIPGFPNLLQDIHAKLKADPAMVTILSDEDIGVIVAGCKRFTQIEVVTPKKNKTLKKSLKGVNVTADML